MRALIFVFAAIVAVSGVASAAPIAKPAVASTKHKVTVWNAQAQVADGTHKPITFIGTTPDKLLPPCRCVAGIWKLARRGETATHFTGTLEALSFNHKRTGSSKKRLQINVRKTRDLMGMHRDYRAALHGIMRASGQLVLREVAGGQWEVVGYAPEPVGKLFANNPRWNADPAKSPMPADARPVVDPDADATALAKLINDYRASLKLPRVSISSALTKVARAHVHDLNVNKPVKEGCNLHSWSGQGAWSSCCYDSSKQAARCMWTKPKEIAGYRSPGYEIAANASGLTPEHALELWQHSPAHHDVMINKGMWTKPWRAMGVAIEGDYGVAWFGEDADRN